MVPETYRFLRLRHGTSPQAHWYLFTYKYKLSNWWMNPFTGYCNLLLLCRSYGVFRITKIPRSKLHISVIRSSRRANNEDSSGYECRRENGPSSAVPQIGKISSQPPKLMGVIGPALSYCMCTKVVRISGIGSLMEGNTGWTLSALR